MMIITSIELFELLEDPLSPLFVGVGVVKANDIFGCNIAIENQQLVIKYTIKS